MDNLTILEEERKGYSGRFSELMTDDEVRIGQHFSQQYMLRSSEIETYKQEWNEIEDMYLCIRNLPDGMDETSPASFVPMLTPNIEGQTASMMESSIDFNHYTNNPAHESYMRVLDYASNYYRKHTRFRSHMKNFTRNYLKFGTSPIKIEWTDKFTRRFGHQGLPRIVTPYPWEVLVDGSIKNPLYLQEARYIIQVYHNTTISWARQEYGDEKADAIAGYTGSGDEEYSVDDLGTFTLLEVWTKDNEHGNLQKIEMDINGLILSMSDPETPYYKYTNNEYPFMFASMIPVAGSFYGQGDGRTLYYIQDTVNKLTDEAELGARFSSQGRTFVDPSAKVDPNEFTSDPSKIILANDPRNSVVNIPGIGVHPLIREMTEFLMRESQKSTRFHESMTGSQMSVSATATQINTQQAQGYVGIKDKKSDIAEVMAWADRYALLLCLEFWNEPFWASVAPGKNMFIDMPSLRSVGQTIPVDTMTSINRIKTGESNEIDYMDVHDDNGDIICDAIEFSTEVLIGESMPKGKTDTYNILLGLSQMNVMHDDGNVKPLISAKRLTELLEGVLGFKLSDESTDFGSEGMMDIDALNRLNPIGNGENIQVPTNLQQTMPQMPNQDPRRVQI